MSGDFAAALISQAFGFLLVLCRCAGCVAFMPAFGEDAPPALLRAGLALALALLLTPVLEPSLPPPPEALPQLFRMLAAEVLSGALLGWISRVVALALAAAGQIISLMTGMSSILQPDLTLGAQSAVIGRLLNLAAPVLILATGLYALPLSALSRSYAVFTPGAFPPTADAAEAAVRAVSGSFAVALRLAAPFVVASTLWQVALGLLSRLVPQLQVYAASLPGQVLGGLLLLALCGTALIGSWLQSTRDVFAALP